MFYSNGKGTRVLTSEMFQHFNNVSLAALIISCGFIIDNTYSHWVHGLSFNMRASKDELVLLQMKLASIGVNSYFAQSRNRYDCALRRLVIPFSEFENLKPLVMDVMNKVPFKANIFNVENELRNVAVLFIFVCIV